MSAGQRRRDDRNNLWLLLLVIGLVVGAWMYAVRMTYTIPHGQFWWGHFYALMATLGNKQLWIPPAVALIFGIILAVNIYVYYKTGFDGADFISRLRGPRMVSMYELADITREWGKKQLSLMGIPVPISKENQHFSVTGSTGTGKSQVIGRYLESAHSRNERTITIDPNGGFMAKFWKQGDKLLNPFDARTEAWTIFNEIKTPYDVDQYAVSLIPKSPSTEGEQWNAMARTIVSEVMLKLAKLNQCTSERLVYWLVEASNDQLQKMLAGTSAVGMFHGAEETLGSVRAVLTRYVTPHKYLEPELGQEQFSIREWMVSGTGNLWIPWREDMLEAMKPLISCWIDVICASSLSMDPDKPQPLNLVVDELDSLEKLNYLIQAATKGRKHQFKIMIGVQSYAQLKETNGENDALTLRNSLRNAVLLGVSEGDTYTTEEMSKGLGEHEVLRRKVSLTAGNAGSRAGSSVENNTERVVKPSEISGLPDLTGYIKFAGDIPIARVRMKHKKWPTVIDSVVLAENKWTSVISQQNATRLKFGIGNTVTRSI